jgi:uncharacterized RDD family membrane protein YckC
LDSNGNSGVTTVDSARVASLWLRLFAGLFDLLPVLALVAAGLWGWWLSNPVELPPRYWNVLDYSVDLVLARPGLVIMPLAAFSVVFIAWETLFTGLIGAAPFARLTGMKVLSGSGARIGLFRASIRAVLSLVLASAAGVGPAWSLLSPRRRMLHDILCGTHVVVGPEPRPRADHGGEQRPPVPEPASDHAGPRR